MKLAEIRKQKGIAQLALANAIHYSQSQLSALENGKRDPQNLSVRTFHAIANALEMSMDDLYNELEDDGR